MVTNPIALGIAIFFGLMTVRSPDESFIMTLIGALITAGSAAYSVWP
jgi:hypothetical protein